jgi:hypothetical protein
VIKDAPGAADPTITAETDTVEAVESLGIGMDTTAVGVYPEHRSKPNACSRRLNKPASLFAMLNISLARAAIWQVFLQNKTRMATTLAAVMQLLSRTAKEA